MVVSSVVGGVIIDGGGSVEVDCGSVVVVASVVVGDTTSAVVIERLSITGPYQPAQKPLSHPVRLTTTLWGLVVTSKAKVSVLAP